MVPASIFSTKGIKRHLVAILGVVILFFAFGGCTPTPPETSKKGEESGIEPAIPPVGGNPEQTAGDTPPVVVLPRLTDANCEDFLSDYFATNAARRVQISTAHGTIEVELFDDTPLHTANFLYLIERQYYTRTQIVRIVPDFVVQGGNSEEREEQERRFLIGDYTLPNEFRATHCHFTGALAMSRSYTDNTDKRSSAYDFYIVAGGKVNGATLHTSAAQSGRVYTEAQRARYLAEGGTPHLDHEHTVFGRVVKGMDVVTTLSRLDRDASDWPVEHLEVKMAVIE
jgi:cyclophilin family peptidyl-prolyl cis-trans isomerase